MDVIFNAQVGGAILIIAVLLVVYLLVIGWTRRIGSAAASKPDGMQAGSDGAGVAAVTGTDPSKTQAPRATERKKKQVLIQGKDAEIAASVLRRMLSDNDRS